MVKTAICGWSARGSNRRITKILLVMKLTVLFITIGILNVCAKGVSQNVSFSGTGVSLETVFSSVEKQTGFLFLYTELVLKSSKPVSLNVQDVPLEKFLSEVFRAQPLKYTIKGKSIFISPKAEVATIDSSSDLERTAILPPTPISGRVVDEDGQPLGGASVSIKYTNTTTVSNSQGLFSINVNEGDILIVSYVEHKTKEIKITAAIISSRSLTVTLAKSTSPLDEVQVIAYGTTSKRLSTGNISTVKGSDIERQPVTTLQQALQGRVPGLNVTVTDGHSASPVKLEIRGRNSLNPKVLSEPLIMVDGIPLNVLNVFDIPSFANQNPGNTANNIQGGFTNTNGENILSFLNPKDIESIDVLKDADATAIYGSRGSNGVILITTKKGKSGPTRLSINVNRATLSVPKYLDLLDTKEYLEVRKEAFRNDGITPTNINAIDLMVWDPERNVNWQKQLYGRGDQTQVDVGLSGGSLQTTYTVSAGYRSTQDLMNNNGKNQIGNVKFNLDHRSVDQRFSLGIGTMLSLSNVDAYTFDGSIYLPPNAPDMYTKDGDLNFRAWETSMMSYYPFWGMKQKSESKSNTVNSNLNISYELLKGLNVTLSAGYGYLNNANAAYIPLSSLHPDYSPVSSAFFGTTNNTNWMIEPQITYRVNWGKSAVNLLLGGSLQTLETRGITMGGSGFADDDLMYSINNALSQIVLERYGVYKYNAVFGRIGYAYDNKYLINLNARRDGSSRFGADKPFGNFGSVGAAWIASDEKFVKNALPKWFSFLKLRASYGSTGGDGVGDYQYLSRWGVHVDDFGAKIPTYGGIQSLLITQPVNQQFQWETTRQWEIGMDMSFLDDIVNVSAAYYSKRSGNQLTQIPTPVYSGFGSVLGNWEALVQNAGFEFTALAKVVRRNDWFVSANFNIGINRNKLVRYPGIDDSPYATLYKVGESLSTRYLLHYTGVDHLSGRYTFEDRNKDGAIASFANLAVGDPNSDRYVALDLNPKYFGGFGVQAAYKNFDLNVHFSFIKQLGNEPYIKLKPGSMSNLILPDDYKENRWQQPGDKALYAKYSTSDNSPIDLSDGAYTDASYIKLNTVALSYELPKRIIQKIKMNSCRLTISTRDLFYITAYKGPTPELQGFNGISPIQRAISTGLMFNF